MALSETEARVVLARDVPDALAAVGERRRADFGEDDEAFMLDLLAVAVRWFDQGHPDLPELLRFVERCLTEGDGMLRTMVKMDFVCRLPPWDPQMAGFLATWPPDLRAEAEHQTDPWVDV